MLAQIVAAVYNVNRSKGRALTADEFMPRYETPREQTPREIYSAFREYFTK